MNQAKQRERFKNLLAKVPTKVIEAAEDEHERFRASFGAGNCYLCDQPLTHFDVTTPCMHWLLKPPGLKKRFFRRVVERFGYFDLQKFLRWVANEDEFATNINDLPVEAEGKLLASTIVYRDLEWSFSCSENDFAGHPQTQDAKHPHYHFQMRVRKQPFIFYNDFHAPFSSSDVATLNAERATPRKRSFPHGEGMHDVLNDDTLHEFVKLPADGKNGEPLITMDVFAKAPTKEGFKVEDVMEAVRQAVKEGARPGAGLLNLKGAKVQGIVRPGPGMTPMQGREGGRARKGTDND
ncbi:UNVERIFIED_ORG: hypothetical protein M2425_005837 [Bradyrhizobium japonicum]